MATMERPRAHSVMQMRPPSQSTFHVRASKLFQKVTAKFARGPPDSNRNSVVHNSSSNDNNSPYMRRSAYSMDGGAAKPYMSQPMLGLTLTHIRDADAADENENESDGSARSSPEGDATRNLNTRRSDGNIVATIARSPPPPPRPTRAPPPPPSSNSNINTTPLTIPATRPTFNLVPATPISPTLSSIAIATALLPAELPPVPDSGFAEGVLAEMERKGDREGDAPPLRRARSQTLSEGRNWSRPSSVVFAEAEADANGTPRSTSPAPAVTSSTISTISAESGPYATAPSTRPGSGSSSVLSTASASTITPLREPPSSASSSSSPPPSSSSAFSTTSSTLSSTSSYATAPSSAFSTLSSVSTASMGTITGLPVLGREWVPASNTNTSSMSGLPASASSVVAGTTGLPPGAARAMDPHTYSPVSPTSPPPRTPVSPSSPPAGTLTPVSPSSPPASAAAKNSPTTTTSRNLSPLSPSSSSSSSGSRSPRSATFLAGPDPDSRRTSIASFATGTSADSWATALAGDKDEDDVQGGEETDREEGAGGGGGEGQRRERERADTLRAGPMASTPSPNTTPPASTTPTPSSSEASVLVPVPTPPPVLGPTRSRSPPIRAATLPPIVTSSLSPSPAPAPVAPVPIVAATSTMPPGIARAQSHSSASQTPSAWGGLPPSSTSSNATPPWGPNGLAPAGSASPLSGVGVDFPPAGHARARTASAGYSYTPTSPRASGFGSPMARFGAGSAREFGMSTGTLPARRAPSIPMSLNNRYSMSFNASGSLTPGGSMIFNPGTPVEAGGGAGRLSPSIIIPVLRLPSLPALPPLSPAPASASAAAAGADAAPTSPGAGGSATVTVGRRSSVIFGPGAHGREASRSVVRSMPALAMEGGAEPGVAAGESDEEDGEGDDADEEECEGERDDEDGDGDGEDEESREGAESPFVPLRLEPTPISLDIAGMLASFGGNKGKGKERAVEGAPSAQPLRPQASQSTVVGKTPTGQTWQHPGDYFSVRTPTTTTEDTPKPPFAPFAPKRHETMPLMSPLVRTVPMPPLPAPERPGMYKHASRSMVDILQTAPSISRADRGDAGTDTEARADDAEGKAQESTEARGEAPAYDGPQRGSTLKRRRSMPEIMAAPPPYTMPLFPLNLGDIDGGGAAHPLAQARIAPRDDEGRETLPRYSNDILLRGVMPRKMEFSAPGVQARDRKWRRVLCELEGTVFRVYRSAGEGWWEKRLGVGDAAVGSAAASAAAAAAARATAAAAREGQEVNKIAGEEGRIPGVGEEGREEGEEGTTEMAIQPRASTSSASASARSRASSAATTPPSPSSTDGSCPPTSSMGSGPASRSRLNLGLSLLKPRSHGRSKSDLPNPPRSPTSPRSSLSIPRPSFGGSPSPGTSSSGASLSTTGANLAPSRSNVSLVSARSSGVLSTRAPATPSSSKGKNKWVGAGAAGTDVPEPDPADLIHAYTMQHAESGLGNDYLKRKHVIRVRLEGQQFLLQARDVGDVVDWIEGFQSAANIALDLDERIMPKGPLFPRRRRRRQRPTNGSEATTNNDPPATG